MLRRCNLLSGTIAALLVLGCEKTGQDPTEKTPDAVEEVTIKKEAPNAFSSAILKALQTNSAEPLLPLTPKATELLGWHILQSSAQETEREKLGPQAEQWSKGIGDIIGSSVADMVKQAHEFGLQLEQLAVVRTLIGGHDFLGEFHTYQGDGDLRDGRGLIVYLQGPNEDAEIFLSTILVGKRRVIANFYTTNYPDAKFLYVSWKKITTRQSVPNQVGIWREDEWINSTPDTREFSNTQCHLRIAGKKRWMEGLFRSWDQAGRLLTSGAYAKSLRTGPWSDREFGGQMSSGSYVQGHRDGIWTGWFGEDQREKAWEAHFQKGRLTGEKRYFERNGRRSAVEAFDKSGNRKLFRSYHSNGTVAREAHYKDSRPHGPDRSFDSTGKLIWEGESRDGRPWQGWCFVLSAGDAGSMGGLGSWKFFKDGILIPVKSRQQP